MNMQKNQYHGKHGKPTHDFTFNEIEKPQNEDKNGVNKLALIGGIMLLVAFLLATVGIVALNMNANSQNHNIVIAPAYETKATTRPQITQAVPTTEPPKHSVKFKQNTLSMVLRQSLSPDIIDENGEAVSEYQLTSSDESVVSVDENNRLTALSEGTADITCTANGISSVCTVTVTAVSTEGIRTDLNPDKPMVALTFDDGPYGDCTRSILNTLSQYNGRATFFMVGTQIEKYSDVVQEVYNSGCEVASHSYDHQYAGNISEDEQHYEIDHPREQIYNITGHYPSLFRCPGGISCDVYENNQYMPLIFWSIDTKDWQTQNSESTYGAVTNVIEQGYTLDGDIVLMHDIQTSTPPAVENICKYLSDRGYQFVTVSELAYYRNISMVPGGKYYSFFKD